MPKGGPGRPAAAAPALRANAAAPGAPPGVGAADVGVVGGLGVGGFSLPLPKSADFLPEAGAGVEDAEDLPLLGLTGSFFALRSPFSLGGVLLRPLVNAAGFAGGAVF